VDGSFGGYSESVDVFTVLCSRHSLIESYKHLLYTVLILLSGFEHSVKERVQLRKDRRQNEKYMKKLQQTERSGGKAGNYVSWLLNFYLIPWMENL
jgi:hypothetical protein